MRNKQQLTQDLINLLPDQQRISVASALPAWWHNIRKTGGMRLTALGYRVFTEDLDLEHYSYAIADPIRFNQHTILQLDRQMQMPYYIHAVKGVPKTIIFFGGKEAVMLNLYGDLHKFLDNYRP